MRGLRESEMGAAISVKNLSATGASGKRPSS